MLRHILFSIIFLLPFNLLAGENFDTLSIKPLGLDYSRYPGTDKLYMVGECEGMSGNQVVVFQNRPSFDYFEVDESYKAEQKKLEKAIWAEILDKDTEPIVVMGRWHTYNGRMVFLCHQILNLNNGQATIP
jgi:hypothetical protein